MECEESLRSYLRAFKNGELSGFNQPMEINNCVTVMLSHWVCSREELEIVISTDNIYCEQVARDVGRDSSLFKEYVSAVNSVLKDEGYPEMDEVDFVERDDIFDCKPYKYKSVIDNPVFEDS